MSLVFQSIKRHQNKFGVNQFWHKNLFQSKINSFDHSPNEKLFEVIQNQVVRQGLLKEQSDAILSDLARAITKAKSKSPERYKNI